MLRLSLGTEYGEDGVPVGSNTRHQLPNLLLVDQVNGGQSLLLRHLLEQQLLHGAGQVPLQRDDNGSDVVALRPRHLVPPRFHVGQERVRVPRVGVQLDKDLHLRDYTHKINPPQQNITVHRCWYLTFECINEKDKIFCIKLEIF